MQKNVIEQAGELGLDRLDFFRDLGLDAEAELLAVARAHQDAAGFHLKHPEL